MEPFFFNDGSMQLYGVFHAADPMASRGRSVLLLYPLGEEYMRIHRSFRRLAVLLAERGFDVLRFDYFGTGDSSGEFGEVTLSSCVRSAQRAYDELVALAPGNSVDLVGLRMGTAVARSIAATRRVARMVLWEPKTRDIDYLREMADDIRERGQSRAFFESADGVLHYAGYAYGEPLKRELEASGWDATTLEGPSLALSSVGVFESSEIGAFFRDAGASVESVDGPDDWITVDMDGGLFFPNASITRISDWLVA